MRTVVFRVSQSVDFSRAMSRMRSWLDSYGCSSCRFKSDRYSDAVLVSVEFTDDADADAFKERFAGIESDVYPTGRQERDTMEQVCWWRLMAEETRAESDQFASKAAKETMAQVAVSYDRLAEDLEKRLTNPRYRNGLFVG
jgi:hypothetical protein